MAQNPALSLQGPGARAAPAVGRAVSAGPADAILAAAIARRRTLLTVHAEYEYAVSTQFVVRNPGDSPDSAASIAMIRETRSEDHWQSPGHYRETILARRAAGHLAPVWNTIAVADIGNFQRNWIAIATHWFPSPVGDDAFPYYRVRLTDTIEVNGHRVFRLTFVPRSAAVPSFVGTIDIADSTWDVVAIDAGMTGDPVFGVWKAIRYRQQFREMPDGSWMPAETRLTGDARMPLPIPGTPRHVAFEQQAIFSNFRFDPGDPSADLDEIRVMVDNDADHADSDTWSAPGAVALTGAERLKLDHGDSAARRRPGLISRIRQAGRSGQWTVARQDLFHFNRVDGAYIGAGAAVRSAPDLTETAKVGYAAGSDAWQYRIGANVQVLPSRHVWLGAVYHDETDAWPGLLTAAPDRTAEALLNRHDPTNYFRERGVTLSLGITPIAFTRLQLRYDDHAQANLPVVTDFSLLRPSRVSFANVPIVAGRLRSLSGTFTWDSRFLLRQDGRDSPLPDRSWTRIALSAEVADPALIRDDFRFVRYTLEVERHQQTLRMGTTTLNAFVGIGTGNVPPQRYFTIAAGIRALGFQGSGIRALGDTSFAGTRIALLSVRHDFDHRLLAESGLPVLRHLPFTVGVYATLFSIAFAPGASVPDRGVFRTATTPYTEAGVTLGNLLPVALPLDLGVQFSWQLTGATTRRIRFGLTVTRP